MTLPLTGAGPSAGGIASPLSLGPALWFRPDDGVFTGGARTTTANDKACFEIADASQTGLDPLALDFSICGWINPSSIAAGTAVEIAKGNESATDVGWCIYRSTANLIFRCGDGVDTVSVTLGTLTAAGAWHFFAVTVDRDGNATGYLNNVANGSPQAMAAIGSMNSADAFSIGASSAQANHAGASFAYVAVANRLWTASELSWMYNLRNARVYAELGIAGTDGAALLTALVSYWNCNETDPTAGLTDQHSTNDLTRTAAELVTNGAMASDTGWTGTTGHTGSYDYDDSCEISGGVMHCHCSGDGAPAICSVGQALTLTTGNSYTFAGSFTRAGGLINLCARATLDPASAGEVIEAFSATNATYSETYTMTGTRAALLLQTTNNAGAEWNVDNLSVKSAAIAVGNGPSEAIASDSVGGYHGTLTGFSASGLITNWSTDVPAALAPQGGYSLTFDGVDDWVDMGDQTALQDDTWTLSFWFKTADTQAFLMCVQACADYYCGCGVYIDSGKLYGFAVTGTNTNKNVTSAASTYGDNAWHHCTLSKSGTTLTLNVDGASTSDTTTSATMDWTSPYSRTVLGANFYTTTIATNYRLAGKLDDARWYKGTALNSTQIAQLYAGGEATALGVTVTPTAHWKLDDGPFGNPTEGDPVWGWESLEGSRYLSNQATAANRPVHRLTGINSLPAEEFDGVNDFLRMAGTAPFTSVDAWTAAVVIQPDVVNVNQAVLGYADEGSANNFLWFGISSDGVVTVQGKVGTNAFSVKGNTALSASTKCLLALTFDGTNYQLRVNGKAQTETRSGTEGSFSDLANVDSWTLGALLSNSTTVGSNPFNGLITEPAIYASEITPSRLAALELYYSRRYGITLTP